MRIALKALLKRPLFLLSVALLAIGHGGAVYLQVAEIQPEEYRRHALDLSVTGKWRYGYVNGHHGAYLVKADNVPESQPPHDSEPRNDDELAAAMSHKLKTYPMKAALETLFYAFLVGYAGAVPWFRERFMPKTAGCGRKMLFDGVAWAVGWTCVSLPILSLGYGASMFTTWGGPGAAGYSGPYPGLITGLPGETISYRPFLEFTSALPLMAVMSSGMATLLSGLSVGPGIWISGMMFYGIAGMLIRGGHCVNDAVDKWIMTMHP